MISASLGSYEGKLMARKRLAAGFSAGGPVRSSAESRMTAQEHSSVVPGGAEHVRFAQMHGRLHGLTT